MTRSSQVALCEQLAVETWAGKGVVLLNAGFLSSASPATLGLPAELQQFVEGVATVWCLMPVAIKGLLGDMHGVVLHRSAPPGRKAAALNQAPQAEPWRILMRQMGSRGEDVYVQVRHRFLGWLGRGVHGSFTWGPASLSLALPGGASACAHSSRPGQAWQGWRRAVST